MKTILDIYKEYQIMPNLQLHMLRVAAVASIICDNMTVPVDKENIVLAELFHDMGNLIKADMTIFPEFFEPEGVPHWEKIKIGMIKKYGSSAHQANIKIMKELGLPPRAIFIADQNSFRALCEHKKSTDMDVKIGHYADGRVAPFGVLSYEERMNESGKRYGAKAVINHERLRLLACGFDIEKQIFEHCKIKPEDITDETVAPIIEELKNYVIE